jgi:putative spermidine/putrescine transport system permease protein
MSVERARPAWLLCLPNCALIAIFLVAPVLGLVQVSFRSVSPTAMTGGGATLANYGRLADWFYVGILWHTVRLALFATMIATILAYPVAYVVARSTGGVRMLVSFLFTVPLMTSVVVKTFGWYIILSRGGPASAVASWLGFPATSLLGNDIAVLIGLAEFSLPFMVFTLSASIERIPRDLEEAAGNLGAGLLMTFLLVIVPLSRAGLLSGFLLCFGISSSAYVVPAVLGSQSARMVAQQIYDDVLVGFNWPGAAALSVILLVLLGIVLFGALSIGRRERAA